LRRWERPAGEGVAWECKAAPHAATLKRIRENMKVKQTARNKGLELTVTVVAYDNGMVSVDGVPITTPEAGWIDAAENVVTILNEFRRQADKRRQRQSP
jgi:hypothetical protein